MTPTVKTYTPIRRRVLVRLLPEAKQIGLIHLPEMNGFRTRDAELVAVSPTCKNKELAAGQMVMMADDTPFVDIEVNGEKLAFCREDFVVGVYAEEPQRG